MSYNVTKLPEPLKLRVTEAGLSLIGSHYSSPLREAFMTVLKIESYLTSKRIDILSSIDNFGSSNFEFDLDELKQYQNFKKFAIKVTSSGLDAHIDGVSIKLDELNIEKYALMMQENVKDCYSLCIELRDKYREMLTMCSSLVVPEYEHLESTRITISGEDLYNWDADASIKGELLDKDIDIELNIIDNYKVLSLFARGTKIVIVPIDILGLGLINNIDEVITDYIWRARRVLPHELMHVLHAMDKRLYDTDLPSDVPLNQAQINRVKFLRNLKKQTVSEKAELDRLESIHSNLRSEYMPNIETAFEKFKSDLRANSAVVNRERYKDFTSFYKARHDYKLKLISDNLNSSDPHFRPFKVLVKTNPDKLKEALRLLADKINDMDNDY